MSVVFPHFPKTPLTLAIYSLSGYLMGATYPRHPLPCPPSKSPQCPVSRGWIEAASSLTKLVKGVSHQLGLWHICLSTPESPETTVVTRHVSSHSLVLPYKYQTKPLWSFRQLHGNINICVHHQRPLLSPGMSVLTSNPFSPLASESLLVAIPRLMLLGQDPFFIGRIYVEHWDFLTLLLVKVERRSRYKS